MAWYNASWTKRYKIPITERENSAKTNFQVLVFLQGNDSSEPNYIDFSLFKSDGSDIRFTKADGTTLLDHHRVYWANGAKRALFVVEVDSLTAGIVTNIFLYGGNSGASTASSPTDTYCWYSDSLDEGNWTDSGSILSTSIERNALIFSETGSIKTKGRYSSFPHMIECTNGDLLAVVCDRTDHNAFGGVLLYRSVDQGKTWRYERLMSGSDTSLLYGGMLHNLPNGNIMYCEMRLVISTSKIDGGYRQISTDNGLTWGDNYPDYDDGLYDQIAPSGEDPSRCHTIYRMQVVGSTIFAIVKGYDDEVDYYQRVACLVSTDNGDTFTNRGELSVNEATEPALHYYFSGGNHNLVAIIRDKTNGSGVTWKQTSTEADLADLGTTGSWSAASDISGSVGELHFPRVVQADSGLVMLFARQYIGEDKGQWVAYYSEDNFATFETYKEVICDYRRASGTVDTTSHGGMGGVFRSIDQSKIYMFWYDDRVTDNLPDCYFGIIDLPIPTKTFLKFTENAAGNTAATRAVTRAGAFPTTLKQYTVDIRFRENYVAGGGDSFMTVFEQDSWTYQFARFYAPRNVDTTAKLFDVATKSGLTGSIEYWNLDTDLELGKWYRMSIAIDEDNGQVTWKSRASYKLYRDDFMTLINSFLNIHYANTTAPTGNFNLLAVGSASGLGACDARVEYYAIRKYALLEPTYVIGDIETYQKEWLGGGDE